MTVWSDIHHDFKQDAQGDIAIAKDIDSVLTSIHNIVHTSPGERVMRPTFACRLKDIIFENMDETLIRMISKELKNTIEAWDYRVTVTLIDFSTSPDDNTLNLNINFTIKGYSEIFEMSTSLN